MENIIYMISFVTGCLICILSVVCFAKKIRQINTAIRFLTVGSVMANIVFTLPLKFLNFSYSFFFALQVASLNADVEETISEIPTSSSFLRIYGLVYIINCMVTPILFGGSLLTFFDGLSEKLVFSIIKRYKNMALFSELNEHSVMLAQSIKKNDSSMLVAFFNEDDLQQTAVLQARKLGFLVMRRSELGCMGNSKKKRLYFEISSDMGRNLDSARILIEQYSEDETNNENIQLFLFNDCPEAELVIDAIDKNGISASIVNEKSLLANDLLFNRPMYENMNGNTLSVLIAGCGSMTEELLKAVIWCGQLGKKYQLKITVADKDAGYFRSVMKKEYPELVSGEYDIEFISADICTEAFEETLINRCPDLTYSICTSDDDELNIKTALYLRGFFLKRHTADCFEPTICCRVRNQTVCSLVGKLTPFNDSSLPSFNIYSFGSDEQIYSYEFLLDSEIEKLAQNCHAVYELSYGNSEKSAAEIHRSYNTSEINKRSSRANAIHIKYKLALLGCRMTPADEADEAGTLVNLSSVFAVAEVNEQFAELEHIRWNAYRRGEGYTFADIPTALEYSKRTGSHIDIRARQHACLCSWSELDAVSDTFGKNFKQYDRSFINCIPAILGTLENSSINVAGVRYIISREEK